jgi:hypothetical protein
MWAADRGFCDIDPEAAKPVPFFMGSVDAVRSDSFDVVLANIHEGVIGEMSGDLERVARRKILSGFRDEEGRWTCVAADENGVTRAHRR